MTHKNKDIKLKFFAVWRERERELLWCNLEREKERERCAPYNQRQLFMKPIWSCCFFVRGLYSFPFLEEIIQKVLTTNFRDTLLDQINTRTRRLTHLLKQAPLTLPDPKLQCFHAVRLKNTLHFLQNICAKNYIRGEINESFSVNFFLHTQKMMQRCEIHPPHWKYCMIRLVYQVPPNAHEREALYSAPFCQLVRDFKRFGVPCWPKWPPC